MDPSLRLELLTRMCRRSGANLALCTAALKEAAGDPTAALNALAARGLRGGRPAYDPAVALQSYAFDTYADRVVDEALEVLSVALDKAGPPLTAIALHAQLGVPVTLVAAYATSRAFEGAALVELDVEPDHGHLPREPHSPDPLLEVFRYRFGFQRARPDVGLFDEEPALTWLGGVLPGALFAYELILAAQRIGEALRASGYPVATPCRAAYARHDERFEDAALQRETVHEALRRDFTSAEVLRGFAELCYATPRGRQRLFELAAAV